MVVAVTHSAPKPDTTAIEIPAKVKTHLGLDSERSWIVLDEVNLFNWPGFDIHPIAGSQNAFSYGFTPPKLYERVKDTLLETYRLNKVQVTKRD